jgi:formylglycine-generating enzyme required for sulfatase activity
MRAFATALEVNDTGHWEAELPDGHVLVHVPAGEFLRGSEDGERDEQPISRVFLDGYWLAKHPVTVGQFRSFVEATGYVTDAERGEGSWQYWEGGWEPRLDGSWSNTYFDQADDHPVASVSWNDAVAFCEWLSVELGPTFRLPTEAQWEKGARGTDGRRYPWGDASPTGRHANLNDSRFLSKYGESDRADMADPGLDDGFAETSPVDQYPLGASPYGILDLAGNLGEWCHDVYDEDYYQWGPRVNPTGPERDPRLEDSRIDRVNRGGAWTDSAVPHRPGAGHSILAAARTGDEQNSSDDHMGFRICVDELPR